MDQFLKSYEDRDILLFSSDIFKWLKVGLKSRKNIREEILLFSSGYKLA